MNGLLNVFVLSKGFWISQNHMNVALFPKIMIIMYQFTIYIIILMHFAVNWHILLHHFLLKEKYIADVNKYVHKVLEEKRDRCNAWQVYVCVKGFASSESQKLLRLKKGQSIVILQICYLLQPIDSNFTYSLESLKESF